MSRSGTNDRNRRRAYAWLAIYLVGVAGAVACGGTDTAPAAEPVTEPTAEPGASAASTSTSQGDPASDDFCNRLSLAEIRAAFGNKLAIGDEPSRSDARICSYSVEDAQGLRTFQFSQRSSIEEYETAKQQFERLNMKVERMEGIGLEAFLVNDAQLEIRASESTAVTLLTQIQVFGGEPPLNAEEIRAGLVALGEMLLTRL